MIPTKTIEELITKHSTLEKDLSSGSLDNKVFAEKSKEYSDVNEIILNAKKYLSFENGKTIALDTTIDESLKNEGMCREIVNRIQNLRKDSEFNVSDKIFIELETNNLVEKAIFENLDYVKNETLAVDLIFKQNLESKSIIEFDNISIKAKIYKTN